MAEEASTKRRAGKKLVKKIGQTTQPKRQDPDVGPALPGEECRVPPHESWTEVEAWVWREVCAGRVADFNARDGLDEPLDPNDPDAWKDKHEGRALSPAFLETVLLREPWHSAIPQQGLRIAGAMFSESIDLSHARLARQFWLDYCRFDSKITAKDLRVDGWFSVEGSLVRGIDLEASELRALNLAEATVDGKIGMDTLQVTGNLIMRKATVMDNVSLHHAKIGGQISMAGAVVKGEVNMNSVNVTGDLFMCGLPGRDIASIGKSTFETAVNKATFAKDVNLVGAKVGGSLDMESSVFKGSVVMDGIKVTRSLSMPDSRFANIRANGAKIGGQIAMTGSTFKGAVGLMNLDLAGSLLMGCLTTSSGVKQRSTFEGNVSLNGAKVGGQLDLSDSIFRGLLLMEGLDVASHLFMRSVMVAKPVNMIFAQLGKSLNLGGAALGELDLTGTSIASELCLGSIQDKRTRWRGDGRMVLRNTHVGALQDRIDKEGNEILDAWPEALQLDGFTYDRLGGFAGSGAAADMFGRGSRWYVDWLRSDATYSPQPYEQLAKVLREAGHTVMAYDVLYASRERAREESRRFKWLGLTLLKWTIGYGLGIRYFWSLGWVSLFTILGAVVHWWGSGQAGNPDIFRLAWLSFDQLLPIAELDKVHAALITEGVLERWALAYFYVHKLIGWLLASFLVAGLAGLTQK